ncbi:unnamed protein product [Microthlaspi erraticum]|uniref:Uncharacterized protein n=1 Tax=Microthlaspi erraticum TaxID=1685480 RepID=A0A6D2IQW3_9BRAS|nr:unnamed protein product [Microthlaspi erraticum]
MSGNQEPRISLPTWRCSDFKNAAIPIKKRKYFVQPHLPAMEETVPKRLGKSPQANEQGGTSVGRSALDSSHAGENQKMIGGSVDKAESTGNKVFDPIRVKVEEPNIPIQSSPLAGFEIPPSSLHFPQGKLSDETRLKVEQALRKAHDIVGKGNLRGDCQRESSAGVGAISMGLGCKTINSSPYGVNEKPTALNLSLSKEVCSKAGYHSGVNRSNWDLNTTMDAWEDALDRKTRVKTTGAFLDSNRIGSSSCRDTTAIAKSVSEKQKESEGVKSTTVTRFNQQVNPTCSLSLGLSSYPPMQKSSSLSEAKAAYTSFSGPKMIAGNVNSLNLRTVKSEVIEESAQVCPMGLSINRVKHEGFGRFNQEISPSSGSLKPVDPRLIKAEPNSFTESQVFNRRDGALNHPHAQIMQSNEISNAPMSLNGMARNPGVQSYPGTTLKENLGQSCSAANEKPWEAPKHGVVHMNHHGDHNLNASGVNVSLTEEKILDDCKTNISKELPHSSRGELSISEVGKRYMYDDVKVQRAAAVFAEGNRHAECGGSEIEQRGIAVPFHGDFQNSNHVVLGNTGENEGRIAQDGKKLAHQIIHASEGMSGVSTLSGGNVENPDNTSPVSYKADMSTIENDPTAQASDKSPVKTLDASDSFVPFRMERDRFSDFPLEPPRKYYSRESDESCKFSRERYHGKVTRGPRLNFMSDRRRFSDKTENNLHDRDTKDFEFDNHGNTRRGGAFTSNFHRGRRPANDEGTPYSHSFQRRTPNYSYNHRGPTNKEDGSAFQGFRDGEKFTRGSQCNNTEPMFMSPPRSYQGRNGFGRGRTKYSDNPKRDFSGFRSRSPVRRSRERSDGPSSSFRNRSQEDFSGNADFSHRRSPSGYRTGRISSPDQSSYSKDMVVRRNSSPPYMHRPSNGGRGRGYVRARGYVRGRGYTRGRGYGRDGFSFRKPYDRVEHRNLNDLDTRERVDYSGNFFEGPNHSERFGVDVNAERRQFGYRHDDGTSSFRPPFNNDGCAPTNVENDPEAVGFGQEDSDMDIEEEEEGSLMKIDGKIESATDNASGRTKNMEEEKTSNTVWQQDERGGDGF